MKRLAFLCLFAASVTMAGCGTPEASNVMDNEDQAAIDAYEQAIAEQDAAMDADSADAEEP